MIEFKILKKGDTWKRIAVEKTAMFAEKTY
jgi:hypothetical protein